MADDRVRRQPLDAQHITMGPQGVLKVSVPLLPAPDEAWSGYFLMPVTPTFPMTTKKGHSNLAIVRGQLEFVTTESSMEDALADIQRREDGTNEWYFRDYLPQLRAVKEKAKSEADEQYAKLQAVRDRFRGK